MVGWIWGHRTCFYRANCPPTTLVKFIIISCCQNLFIRTSEIWFCSYSSGLLLSLWSYSIFLSNRIPDSSDPFTFLKLMSTTLNSHERWHHRSWKAGFTYTVYAPSTHQMEFLLKAAFICFSYSLEYYSPTFTWEHSLLSYIKLHLFLITLIKMLCYDFYFFFF